MNKKLLLVEDDVVLSNDIKKQLNLELDKVEQEDKAK